MTDEWMTTGEVARQLGVSRQHVVDLCDRGDLFCIKVGTHRRINRAEARRLVQPELSREQMKSLWLHRALLGPLMRNPGEVLRQASDNIERWLPRMRPDGMAAHYLQEWRGILDGGIEGVVRVLTSTDTRSVELRQNSPFAGVLDEEERRQVLRAFRACWSDENAVA